MSYVVTVLACVDGSRATDRVLATATSSTLGQAKDWISRNRESFRAALHDRESHFEAWVADGKGEMAFHVRHPRDGWGDDGEVLTRSMLREMARAKAAPSKRTHLNGQPKTPTQTNGQHERAGW